ncbi:MAG: cyclic nucleotide-binding domain-containing protein [Anaerolineales bacterium]|nr:cyclic nucleotide-binding domain-containing protein [Anaerolineales bacterium]
MLIIERVAILRSLDLFRDTPDYILASVAQIIEEISLQPEETLIGEGEHGDCMYIIVEGSLRVHSQGQTIIVLDAGTTVGELAVLDPEPRTASVTAVSDSFLFRIAKEPFDEVLVDRPEIALGVIRTLSRRLRAQGRRLAELAPDASD